MTSVGLERPWALLAAPVGLFLLLTLSRRALGLVRAIESSIDPAGRPAGRRTLVASLAARAALVISLALLAAGPYVVRVERVSVTPDSPLISRAEAQIVILLDASKSMGYPLGAGGGTRMEAAEEAVMGILRSLSPGDLVTLIAFAGDAEVLASGPSGEVARYLEGLEADRNFTALGDALVAALAVASASGRPTAVVLVSDGGNNGGTDPIEAARRFGEAGIPLLVIQVGRGASADPALMADVARSAGGEFRWLGEMDESAIESLAAEAARTAKYEALRAAGRAYVEVEVTDERGLRTLLSAASAVLLLLALAGGA